MEYGIKSCFGKLRRVAMHRPYEELELVTDPSAWGFRARPNKERAAKEFDAVVDLLESENIKVDFLEEGWDVAPPNLYFTADLGICTSNGLIMAYFRHEYRQGEELFLEVLADELEIPVFGRVRDAYFEGGDFVPIDSCTAALGISERTSVEGFHQVCEFVDQMLIPVPYQYKAHLDALFTMLDEHLAIAYEDALPNAFLDFLKEREIELISISEEQQRRLAADVLRMERDKVVIGDDCVETIAELEDRGVDVIPVELKELKKGNGGPGCFTLTLLRK